MQGVRNQRGAVARHAADELGTERSKLAKAPTRVALIPGEIFIRLDIIIFEKLLRVYYLEKIELVLNRMEFEVLGFVRMTNMAI